LQQAITDKSIIDFTWEEENCVQVKVEGGPPYGQIEVNVDLPTNYPFVPPTMTIASTIFHPNVYKGSGLVCMSALDVRPAPGVDANLTWSPTWNIATLMKALQTVIAEPNVNSPANIDANKDYMWDREVFNAKNRDLALMRNKLREQEEAAELERKWQEEERVRKEELERDAGSRAREIRYEQEQEFQEALKKDQEREKKIAMEELRRQEEAAEEKRKQKDEERARKAEQYRVGLIQQQKKDLRRRIPEEPETSDPSAVRVVIKLPGGQRMERRFLLSHSLQHIYYFVFCHPDSPNEFEIVSNYPKRRIACKPTEEPISLAAAGFSKSEMLFVNDLES